MDKEKKDGWECPRCKCVNAPSEKKCTCIKTEDKDKDSKELLLEEFTGGYGKGAL